MGGSWGNGVIEACKRAFGAWYFALPLASAGRSGGIAHPDHQEVVNGVEKESGKRVNPNTRSNILFFAAGWIPMLHPAPVKALLSSPPVLGSPPRTRFSWSGLAKLAHRDGKRWLVRMPFLSEVFHVHQNVRVNSSARVSLRQAVNINLS